MNERNNQLTTSEGQNDGYDSGDGKEKGRTIKERVIGRELNIAMDTTTKLSCFG